MRLQLAACGLGSGKGVNNGTREEMEETDGEDLQSQLSQIEAAGLSGESKESLASRRCIQEQKKTQFLPSPLYHTHTQLFIVQLS